MVELNTTQLKTREREISVNYVQNADTVQCQLIPLMWTTIRNTQLTIVMDIYKC